MSLASQVSLAITAIGVQIKALRISAVQPGDYIYSGATTRAGALPCTGGSYLRTDYPALFAALGGTSSPYGLPDSTHFNVPNVSGRFLVASGLSSATGAATKTLAAIGGEEKHTLVIAELAGHSHVISATQYGPASMQHQSGGAGFVAQSGAGAVGAAAPSPVTDGAGTNTAHNVMNPYLVANVFIKT